MILVDHILGYEGGAFVELETDGLITNGAVLGIVMMIPTLIIWALLLFTSQQKPNITGGE